MFAIWLLISVGLSAVVSSSKDVGDSCQVARTGAMGECRIIDNCAPAIDDIVKRQQFPASCGFIGHKQIVCCSETSTPRTTTTPAPVADRISARSACTVDCFGVCFQLIHFHFASFRVQRIPGGVVRDHVVGCWTRTGRHAENIQMSTRFGAAGCWRNTRAWQGISAHGAHRFRGRR